MPLTVASFQPVYGQEKSPKSGSHPKTTEDAKSQAAPAPPALTPAETNGIKPGVSDARNDGTKIHPESYLGRLFSPENLPNIGLLIAAVVGIIVAVRTLVMMWRQTKATEVSAQAAIMNAQAVIDSERARVTAELIPTCFGEKNQWHREDGSVFSVKDILLGKHLVYRLRIINLGRTPARILNYQFNYGPLVKGTRFSPADLQSKTIFNVNAFLAGGESRNLDDIHPRIIKGT